MNFELGRRDSTLSNSYSSEPYLFFWFLTLDTMIFFPKLVTENESNYDLLTNVLFLFGQSSHYVTVFCARLLVMLF